MDCFIVGAPLSFKIAGVVALVGRRQSRMRAKSGKAIENNDVSDSGQRVCAAMVQRAVPLHRSGQQYRKSAWLRVFATGVWVQAAVSSSYG